MVEILVGALTVFAFYQFFINIGFNKQLAKVRGRLIQVHAELLRHEQREGVDESWGDFLDDQAQPMEDEWDI